MTVNHTPTFGQLLRRHRRAASLSQAQLGERAQVSSNAIAALERGRRTNPRPETATRLAEALGLSPADRRTLITAVTGAQPTTLPGLSLGGWQRLPALLTSFVGRKAELAELRHVLPTRRLVTLTGSGGVGKTRLAMAVASALANSYLDGMALVELAPLAEPSVVPHAVAELLGVPEQAGRRMEDVLAQVLESRHLLLVLDNCEHLVAACAGLADLLLRGCPRLQILATSREPLDIAGEVVWRVPPLSIPEQSRDVSPQEAAQHDAVQLFVERAEAARPDFGLDERNAPSVVEVCRRLDGIPLAIELAAARVRVLGPEQILERLGDRFRLLVGGSRTAPSRQQTLRATIDWSYGLLSDVERVVFDSLSVFAGSWSLEACEAVCASATVEAVAPSAVLDLLTQLIDKSLVLAEPSAAGDIRYRMLETLRAYASDRLQEGGDANAVRARHTAYFLDMAEWVARDLKGPDEPAALERLQRERDNLRAALAWSIDTGNAESGMRLAGALVDFWARGYMTEGRAWLTRILELDRVASPRLRAIALCAAGSLARAQLDGSAAVKLFREGLELARACGDQLATAMALKGLGNSVYLEGVARVAVYEEAEALLSQSLALFRQLSLDSEVASGLWCLGNVVALRGDAEAAEGLYHDSLAISEVYGPPSLAALNLHRLGHLACVRGDSKQATSLLEQGLHLSVQLDHPRGISHCVGSLALVAASRAEWERAARLLGACAGMREALGMRQAEWHAADLQRGLDAARNRLGDAPFHAAWAAGRSLSVEQAVGEALIVAFVPGTRAARIRG